MASLEEGRMCHSSSFEGGGDEEVEEDVAGEGDDGGEGSEASNFPRGESLLGDTFMIFVSMAARLRDTGTDAGRERVEVASARSRP